MSLETAIQNLADAINRLADAKSGAFPQNVTPSIGAVLPAEEPKRRGRPPSKKAEPVEAEPPAVEETAPAPAEEAPVMVEVTKPVLQTVLIEVVKKHGREACGALCRKHGGPNLSALDPKVYPALYADAQAALAADAG